MSGVQPLLRFGYASLKISRKISRDRVSLTSEDQPTSRPPSVVYFQPLRRLPSAASVFTFSRPLLFTWLFTFGYPCCLSSTTDLTIDLLLIQLLKRY